MKAQIYYMPKIVQKSDQSRNVFIVNFLLFYA